MNNKYTYSTYIVLGEDEYRQNFPTKKAAEEYLKNSYLPKFADFVSVAREDKEGNKEGVKSKYNKF